MKNILGFLFVGFVVLGLGGVARAQQNFDEVEITAIPVVESAGIYMLQGAGGNIGVSVGSDGAFVIDDQYAPLVPKIKAAIAKLTDKPVKFVVNTHWHGDHTGGNENLAKDGVMIFAHDNVRKRLKEGVPARDGRAAIAPAPVEALPIVTFAEGLTFHWNGHTIEVSHVQPAHTDGDSIIYFREANVIHMGDNYTNGSYPFIDAASGGSIRGLIANVTAIANMIDNNTKVIPGHGGLSNKRELLAFRNMLQTSADRIGKLKQQGKTLEQTLAAKPTKDLDEKWGGRMPPERWVEIVYSVL